MKKLASGRDVVLALAQRRHLDRHDVQPVVEVLAELAGLDHRRQVAVGGGDQPHVDLDRPRAAEPLELVLLQDAQDLGLRVGAHVADFVEEQRAAVGLLEAADALLVGAGERALLVTEQLGLEQVLLQRRAVHLDEVARRAMRVVVDRAGDELLAGAGLAADQHRRVALGDLADDAEHLLERAARPDDAVEVVDVALRVTEVVDLVLHPAHLERLLDLDLHLLDFERLLHVVERAGLHRLDGRRHRAERGHQDDRGRRVQRLRGLQHLEPGAAAHLQVADDDVEEAFVQLLDGGVAVRRLLDVVALLRQAPARGRGAENRGRRRSESVPYSYSSLPPVTGSVTRIVVP